MNENLIKLYDILSILNGEDLEKRKIAENELEIEKKKKKKDFLLRHNIWQYHTSKVLLCSVPLHG